MSFAVKIPPQGDPTLGFDLAEVMSAVGSHGNLRWRLKSAELVLDTAPDDARQHWEAVESQARTAEGADITWADMERLSRECLQVIDGTFTGYRGSVPHLQIAAIDSSYWIIWTEDLNVIDRVRRAFRQVTDYEEPTPSRCPEP